MKRSNNYLHNIPKPLLEDIVNNKVVPIIGAGFAKNADVPEGKIMPDWKEMGKMIADEIEGYKYDNNAIDALSYYEKLYSRPALIEKLMSILNNTMVEPGETYLSFCHVFTDLICTTNFDFLLENAFNKIGNPFSVIATEDRLTIGNQKETTIIKLHGDFNHPNRMVITENDYDVFINNNPILCTYISNLFITKTMLLIGYSLEDSDFRNVWQIINSRLGKMSRPAYCILVKASEADVARFERRNIRAINIEDCDKNYKEVLKDLFEEINEYKTAYLSKNAKSTDEHINAQLMVPKDSNSLCYLCCLFSRAPFLKEMIQPALLSSNLTLMQINDLILPENNFIDNLNTTISKANKAIIDLSVDNEYIQYETSLVNKLMDSNSIIFIIEEGKEIPNKLLPYTQNKIVLTYSLTDESEGKDTLAEFIRQLEGLIKNETEYARFENAQRLIDKKEYGPAVISAFSELESIFYKKFDTRLNPKTFDLLIKNGNLQKAKQNLNLYTEIRKTRNQLVHNSDYGVTEEQSKELLNCAKELASLINSTPAQAITS